MKNKVLTYIITAVLSAVLLCCWSLYALDGADIFKHTVESAPAKILTIDSEDKTEGSGFISTVVVCSAEIIGGKHKSEIVKTYQEHNSEVSNMKIVQPGDVVIIKNYPIEELGTQWAVDNYRRTPTLLLLIFILVFFVILFGRAKGLRTVISLVYTCLAVFAVFVPSVLSGKNIYSSGVLVCIFIITMTLLMVNGADRKTLSAALGCMGGVLAAAVITLVFSYGMKFAGYTNQDSYYLTLLPKPVDLKAISFAAIIIGAVGAVMDVAMSISSALYEMTEKIPDISFKSLVGSGFAIGRDMMGTMSNTLILAYMGSSVSCVLLLLTYADSASDVFNHEMIAYEILQAVAGSLGILLAIPLTTLICAAVYLRKKM